MKYKAVAEKLALHIMKNMKPGERLPGMRELSDKEGITLVTARNVYRHLMEKGLVTTRQGSGTYVASSSSGGVIDMSTIRPPEELLLWVGRHLGMTMEGLHSYDPPEGYEPLRTISRQWLASLGIDHAPIITAGAQQALFLVGLSLLRKGDVVAVEDPGYRGAARIFESLGAKVETTAYLSNHHDLDCLASMGIRMLYTMPQGHIPTGRSIPEGMRDRLLKLARDKDFFIIEDDPFSEVLGISPLKARDSFDRVIYIKSLSTMLGPGLRMGFTVVPASMYAEVIKLKEINDLSLSGILQRCLYAIFASSDWKEHVERLKIELKCRQDILSQSTLWSTKGPCLWIQTPIPSRISQEKLLGLGVRITPGDIYGSKWSRHIRLSLLTPSRMDFKNAIPVIQGYLKDVTGPSLTEF